MNNNQKHIKNADFKRYLNNEMSEGERNAFEKLLQKYPFEAEALEGMQSISSESYARDMEALHSRLKNKNLKSSKTIWWATAAAVVILAGSALLWNNLNEQANPVAVAEHIEPKKEIADQVQEPKNTRAASKGAKTQTKSKPEQPGQESQHAKPSEPVEDDIEVVMAEEPAQNPDLKGAASEKMDDPAHTEKEASEEEQTGNIEIIVVEEETQNRATETESVADIDFSQPTPSAGVSAIVKSSAASQINVPTLEAQPMMDEQEYEAWLRSQASLEADEKMDSVLVILNLHIDENGTITKFENTNQARQKYFKEARKIILSGPPWQPAMRNGIPYKSTVEQRVVFRKAT